MKKAKRLVSWLLTLALAASLIPAMSPGAYAAAYYASGDWSNGWGWWSQSQSAYEGVRDWGCYLVAKAKMLVAAGVASGDTNTFNPDKYYEWEKACGYTNSGMYSTDYAAPQYYADSVGKSLTYEGVVYGSDTAKVWQNIREGKLTILRVWQSHYIFVNNEASQQTGKIRIFQSWSGDYNPPGTRDLTDTIRETLTYRVNKNVHTHDYSQYVCSCGDWQSLSETPIIGSQQSYIVKTAVNVYNGPYTQCGGAQWLGVNTPLACVASVTNKAGQMWYKLGGQYNGKWILASSAEYHPASDIAMFLTVKDMTEGETNAVQGNVVSSYYTMQVTAYLDGKAYYSNTVSKGSLMFANSEITSRVGFESLSPGDHTIRIVATDGGGGSVDKSATFNVKAAVAKPTISNVKTVGGDPRTNEEGGKVVSLSCATGGAAIYYTLDGTDPTRESTRYGLPFKVTDTSVLCVRAFLNDKQSAVLREEIRIHSAQDPAIAAEDVPEGTRVTITGEEGAIIYYRVSGVSNEYTIYKKPFILTQNATVSAYAEKTGCKRSSFVSSDVEVKVPETPAFLSPVTNVKYAQNSTVTFKWERIANAASYDVNIYLDGTLNDTLTVTEPNASICLESAGTYAVSVTAKNAIGSSSESDKVNAISVAPLTVRYEDYDGSVISEQIVDFGGDAVQPAEDPVRKGYFFLYWDGSPNNITEDTTINAVYRIRSYDVVFYDQNGNLLGYKQTVEYGGSADVPNYSVENLPTGYKFLGWNIQATDADSQCDYNYVDSDMKITAVVGWFDQELPLIAEITSATRDDGYYSEANTGSGNYNVTVRVTNWNQGYTTALLRVSLKTTNDKMVKTEARTIGLPASGTGDYSFVLNYSGTATQVEALAIGYDGDNKTGSALSQAVSKTVQVQSGMIFNDWTDWSDIVPAAQPGRVIEEKTQYKYKIRQVTTSAQPSLDGWTQYDAKITSWGNWSGWLDNAVTATPSRQVETQQAISGYNMITNCVTARGNRGWAPSSSGYILRQAYAPEWWSKTQLDSARVFYDGSWFDYASNVAGWVVGGTAYCKWDGSDCGGWAPFFIQSTTYKTQYRYRDAIYTYYYYKDSDSEYCQDTMPTAANAVNVEQTTAYRYKDKDVAVYDDLTGTEDNTGRDYTFEGVLSVDTDLAEKIATVMVYKGKNSDPNESQLQYVGQTTIGSGNTYDISFKTKDEPTIASGDYIVSLGLQGATGLVNIGMIEAPKPTYTVNFYSESTLVNSQTVEEGGNVELPAAPEREGYRFVAWSETGRNVHGDISISAIFVPITYAVAFVDWVNGSATPFALEYGTDLTAIAEDMIPEADGYTFQYWDAIHDGNTTVTGNMVISAVYEAKTFTVNFYDGAGEDKRIIATRDVAFGQAAELPDDPTYDDKTFLGWSTDVKWWDVRSNMDVYPILEYNETAGSPISTEGTYLYGMQDAITLRAADGALIYYTTDGTDPVPGESGILYNGPISLNQESTVIKAIAVEENKNNSEVVDIFFDYSQGDDYEVINEKTVVQQYSPIVAGGDSLAMNIKVKNNPGIEGFLFFVECDPSVYYMDYEENVGYSCDAGELTQNGTYFVMPDENGWRILWFNTEAATEDGTLFTLNLKVADTVTAGSYPISVSYSAENMVTSLDEGDEFDAEFEGGISGATVVGDVNGDNDVTLADVILIAKYKAGLYAISELSKLNAADVNRDGSVTLADVVFLARFIIGLESAIPNR